MSVLIYIFPAALIILYALYYKINSTPDESKNKRTFDATIHASKRRRKVPKVPAGPPVYEVVNECSDDGDPQIPLDQIELLTPEQMFYANKLPKGLARPAQYRYSYQAAEAVPTFGPYYPHGAPIIKLPKPSSESSDESDILPQHRFIRSPRKNPPQRDPIPSTLRYVDNIEKSFYSPSRRNLLEQLRKVTLKRTGKVNP